MEPHPRELRVYETSPGISPFDDWLNGLRDKKGRAVIDVRIGRMESGNFGDCDPVGEGVRELKIDFGSGYRVYFAEDGPRLILLLVGGNKTRQAKDIKQAKAFWRNFKERVRDERKLPKL